MESNCGEICSGFVAHVWVSVWVWGAAEMEKCGDEKSKGAKMYF